MLTDHNSVINHDERVPQGGPLCIAVAGNNRLQRSLHQILEQHSKPTRNKTQQNL